MTIIAGGSRSNARFFAWHLQRTDGGQTVDVRDVEGLIGDRMEGWFEQIEAMALGGRTTNAFYHFSLNPRPGEAFTDEQVDVAVKTTLHNLGLEGQPYFLVRHGGKDGRPDHFHCIALRVDLDTGKAISDSHNYAIHMRTAQELEERFSHQATERARGLADRNPDNWEVKRGKDTEIEVEDLGEYITALYRQSDTGPAFAAALDANDLILAEGRKGLCVIDWAGKEHSLARRVDGARKADIDARLAGIDRESLPTVKEAKAIARERAAERKDKGEGKKHDHEVLEAVGEAVEHAPGKERSSRSRGKNTPAPEAAAVASDRSAAEPARPAPSPDPERSAEAVPKPEPVSAATTEPTVPAPAPDAQPFDAHVREFLKHQQDAWQAAAQLPPDASPPPNPEPTAFASLTGDLAQAANNAAPMIGELTVAPVAVEPGLSAFERVAQERMRLLRDEAGDGLFIAEGIDWRARQSGTPLLGESPDGERSPFERVAWEKFAATRDNGGEPVTRDGESFWRRGVEILAAAAQQLLGWARDHAQDFLARVATHRDSQRDDNGIER